MNIIWSAQARRDLRALEKFIARDSAFYAHQQVERIIEKVEAVATHPAAGHPVHEFPAANLREAHEGSHRIIYSFDDSTLSIVTIVHMKQLLDPQRVRGRGTKS